MPTTSNLAAANAGIGSTIQSVLVWLFPGPPFAYPQPPAAVPVPQTEVSASLAHFLIYEGFDRRNASGNSLGRGSIDTGSQTVMQFYKSSAIEDLLIAAFPPPGPA